MRLVNHEIIAWLEVDGERFPVDSVQCDYELNGLPRATVSVPLGLDVRSLAPSPAHALIPFVTSETRASIYAVVNSPINDTGHLGVAPGEPALLFDGYVAGIGASKSSAPEISLTLSLRHWLSDLNHSSVFSRWSHPTNPADLSTAAAVLAGGAGAATKPLYGGAFDVNAALTAANVSAGIWESAVKPFFLGLTTVEGLAIPEAVGFDGVGLGGIAGDTNDEAAAALARVFARPETPLNESGDTNLATQIAMDLAALLGNRESLAGSTFWDVLTQGIAAEYLLAVSPRVSDALIVPYVAAPVEHFVEITDNDIWGCQLGCEIPRPVRAFGVLSHFDSSTGVIGRPGEQSVAYGLGGWYAPPGMGPGSVRVTQCPRWAAQLAPSLRANVFPPGRGGRPAPTAEHPDGGAAANRDAAPVVRRAADRVVGFLGRYARARLVMENALSRQGVVTGPPRLDIAPGTSVKLNVGNAIDGVALIGTVLRISTAMSTSGSSASTTLHLGYLRSEAENENPAIALDEHPLYSSTFIGAPLYLD